MRLICPNCDAQYEVDDAAIPEAGRDVQCSNCGHAWFQIRETLAEDLTQALYREPEPEPVPEVPAAVAQTEEQDEDAAPPPPPRAAPVQRSLDESVLAILREEAERELAARKAEAQSLEMQGDLGLPPPVSPAVGSAAAAATEADPADAGQKPAAPRMGSAVASRVAARRDLLPDIEEINSSLRPNDAAQRIEALAQAKDEQEGRSGFRSGFVLVLVIAGLAAMLYLMAPQISAQIPGTAEALGAYVAAVDAARLAIDGLMQRATGALNGMTNN